MNILIGTREYLYTHRIIYLSTHCADSGSAAFVLVGKENGPLNRIHIQQSSVLQLQALMARSSSPRSGCVVDSPFFSRATCSTRLSRSTWCNLSAQASDTRCPWRNIKRIRQRSRNSVRLPRVAVIRRSTSVESGRIGPYV